MNLSQTYGFIPHPVSGQTFIQRTGLKKVQGVNECRGKSSRDRYRLAKECEINTLTDSIQWMTKNEMRKAKRNNLKK